MPKKKRLPILLAILCAAIILFYLINRYTSAQNIFGNAPQQGNTPSPEGELLVIPEAPLGTVGLLSALAAGLAIYMMIKKVKPSIPKF